MQALQKILSIFIVTILLGSIQAQDVDYSGTSAANLLKIPVGARIAAMGDAGSALADDATSLFWNPAAAARINSFGSISISTMNWLVDSRLSYLAGVINLGGFGYVGVDFEYLDYGNMEVTTVYDQDGTGRYVSASDLVFGLAYARKLTDRFSFGIKLKYIGEKLASVSGSAFGVDIGADFQTSFFDNNFRISAALSNFGTQMKFEGYDLEVVYTVPGSPSNKQVPATLKTRGWEIPLLFRFGVSNYFIKNKNISLLAAYEVMDSRDYEVRHNLGAEFGYRGMFFLRGGYKFNYDEVTYTAGFGLNFAPLIDFGLVIDYVFLDYGVFESLHQFSIAVNF
ncbi:MAG TPA: PorV/PorQ family protein [Caldithrix abyssi]|uniref:PorV/PorQ family protein n=1 Tax=Caldithrix abyssi TaxID=187145 RepID=A0A7V4TXB1_CALAY|nr:PorV/PorQ family protein [Caldithrix abyssi]